MPKDRIDEEKIQFEALTACFRANRYNVVNDTKIRSAISSNSYEEFRNLVKCAQNGQNSVSSDEMKFFNGSESEKRAMLKREQIVERTEGEDTVEDEFRGFNMRYRFNGKSCVREGELLEKYAKNRIMKPVVDAVYKYRAHCAKQAQASS